MIPKVLSHASATLLNSILLYPTVYFIYPHDYPNRHLKLNAC